MRETHKWIFIGDIPILYETARVAKQFKIEMWLDSSPLMKALDLKPIETPKKEIKYIT
ncbi:MAG: hypothetical protein QXN63_02925 [Candidatus Bathyarchaeia archaeon]